jgi:crotonobetainyl-CoA:carnitine CoA-transferase CaiB-like acyl-CoA transferase
MSDDRQGPLASLRILDLTSEIAGPYATKLFVDAGASVIKIESPDGDPMRHWTASQQNLASDESSPLFQYLNAGKRSIVLDPRDARDRARFNTFAARSQIVFEDWGAGGLESRGLTPDGWLKANPQLSIVRISPWGQSGPWAERAANDFTLQAATGSVEYRGLPDREPIAAGGRLGDWIAGSFACVSGLAAWRSARQTGAGQIADLSQFEAMIQCLTVFGDLGSQFSDGLIPRSVEIPSIEPTADGHVGVCTQTGQQWTDFCAMMGQQELAQDPRFLGGYERMEQIDFIQGIIRDWTRKHTTAEIIELCEILRIPVAPIGNGKDLPGFDHMVERQLFSRTPGGFLQPRTPWRLETTEPRPVGPTPSLDEHREELLLSLEKTQPVSAINESSRGVGHADLPFAGLRVIDLTAFWAGPYTTSMLSDFGADVIKVESIQRPDGMRFAGSVRNETIWEWSHVFHGANPGKRGITLRLDKKDGLELLKRLIADADLVIENFSARVMPAFGLDATAIKSLNPRAIFVRMPAFGLDGPWRDRAGFAMTVEQVSGLAWVTGYEDMPLVIRGACDPIGSAHAIFAIGLALEERDRTGLGQVVEVALVEPALAVAAEQVIEYSAFGVQLGRSGNSMPHAAPQGIFESRTESERVAISVSTDEQWRSLCGVLEMDSWRQSEELATHGGRLAAHDKLVAGVSAWVRTRSRDEVLGAMLDVGVPASASINNHRLMPNEQLEARQFFQTMKHPLTGPTRYPSFPASFSGFERDLHRVPPPTLGQHNREILQSELGVDDTEYERLETEQIIGSRPSFM